jgi:general secretion pathway protein A
MYTSFFGLNEKPFTITPDPRYLFMSERHGEGLAHLVYGVTESGGFIQLTGEVGTGKTTLVRTLLGQIPAEVDIALILNPQLTALEFLLAICEELGVPIPSIKNSSKAMVDALNRHLLDAHSRGRRVILLIDEAQNLSEGVLEQLRLLTNLETARQKLLQIILIAQPELREKLSQDSLRQLAQRITGRYHLEPLSREEASKYIDHRLRVAGALTEIFTPAAKQEVYRMSGGVPRVMNVICDRALLGAYSRETRVIDKDLVRKAAGEVAGQKVTPVYLKWLVPVLGVAGLVLVISVLWSALGGGDTSMVDDITISQSLDSSIEEASIPEAVVPEVVAEIIPPAIDIDELFVGYNDIESFQTLFDLWNETYDSAKGTACEQAIAAGLRCYFQRGTWTTLQQLDRPAIITLTGKDGSSWRTALVGLDENEARLIINGAEVDLPIADLAPYWFGQALLLWRPLNGNDQPIGPAASAESIQWLRQSLAALDRNTTVVSGTPESFDDELVEQLQAFQRKHRLEADGIAGLKTQIILNSLLETDETPRLSASR